MKEFLRLAVPGKINLKGGGEKASTLLLKAVQDLDISTEPNLLLQHSCHLSVTMVPILHLKHISRLRERNAARSSSSHLAVIKWV